MGDRMAQVRRAMARIPALSELNVHCQPQPATCLPLAMGGLESWDRGNTHCQGNVLAVGYGLI